MLALFAHLIQVVPLGGTPRRAPILMHACTVFVCVTVQMLVYPNQLDVPLMENSGLPKAPVGMLEVTVEKATGLKGNDVLGKGDPYLRLQVQVCPRCQLRFFLLP
jgi:Ca2+-dependent lipid-binding protein